MEKQIFNLTLCEDCIQSYQVENKKTFTGIPKLDDHSFDLFLCDICQRPQNTEEDLEEELKNLTNEIEEKVKEVATKIRFFSEGLPSLQPIIDKGRLIERALARQRASKAQTTTTAPHYNSHLADH